MSLQARTHRSANNCKLNIPKPEKSVPPFIGAEPNAKESNTLMALSPKEMRDIFDRTVMLAFPHGIIKGYHELPYICLGDSLEDNTGTMRVREGCMSPSLSSNPGTTNQTTRTSLANEVDVAIAGRVFGFLGFPNKPVGAPWNTLNYPTIREP